MKRISAAAMGLALVLAGAVLPARAEFNVCNKTASRVGVAVGYLDQGSMTTEGWWTLRPGACEVLLPGPLGNGSYYIHARDWEKGGTWRGTRKLCTQTKVFTIADAENCAARDLEEADFFEIDTGDAEDWTVDLVEN